MASQYQTINIPVKVWLQTIALPEYEPFFVKYKGAEELFDITEKEVLQLGIQNFEHRSRIVSSLKLLGLKCRGSVVQGAMVAFDKGAVRTSPKKVNPNPIKSQVRLQSELDAEFALPTSDLRSMPWFHGKISRENAEKLVRHPGEFLVRESISQSGLCVLTSNHQGQALHFVINKFTNPAPGGAVVSEYGFESSRFSTIQALISSHFIDGLEITSASHAKIKIPLNRKVPLSQIESELSSIRSKEGGAANSSDYEVTSPSVRNLRQSPGGSPPSPKTQTVMNVNSAKISRSDLGKTLGRVGSEPRLNEGSVRGGSRAEQGTPNAKLSSNSLTIPDLSLANRAHSEGELNVSPAQLPVRSAELKTSRNTSAHPVVAIRNRELYDDGADYSDYFEVKRMPDEKPSSSSSGFNNVHANQSNSSMQQQNQLNMRLQAQHPSATSSQSTINADHVDTNNPDDEGGEDYDTPAAEIRDIHQFTTPTIPTNYIDAYSFKSDLLSNQNKPLDPDCMYKMKEVLMQVNHSLLSQHITYLDLHLLKVIENRNLGAGIFSGIEALTLPQGQHFRQAAIERHCSLSFIVSVTILACTDDLMERSKMMKQWMLIARELLRSHGNLFSFAAIMQGLSASSIERLVMTWTILERYDPVLMNQWKTKLKPSYKELRESLSCLGSDDTSVPYVTPICELLDNEASDEYLRDGSDLDAMLAHLDSARLMVEKTSSYSRRGTAILRFFAPRPDLRDLFKVELQMRLLFGHMGASAERAKRKVKFEQILNILSTLAESHDVGTEF